MGQRTNTAKLNWLVYNVGSYWIIKHSLSDRACVAWFSFQLGQCKETESHDRAGNTVYSVCVTNGKDMAIQRQIWSTFVTVLWFRKTEIQDRAGILVFVRVLWVTISKIYWQFWHSFFIFTFFFFTFAITSRAHLPKCWSMLISVFPSAFSLSFLIKASVLLLNGSMKSFRVLEKKGQDYHSQQRKLLCSLQKINGYKACILVY